MPRTTPRFGRVLTAIVTPFDAAGALDLDAARRLARWLVEHGNDGLVVAGTTGESPTLSDDEKLSLFAAVAEAVTVPVIAGTGSNDTAHSVHLTREATRLGVAGILAVCPYYNRPPQSGIEAHLRAIAAATTLPVVIYDIPVRTGRKIATATLARLAREVPNAAALKDAAGNPAETAVLMSQVPASFELLSGDDNLTLPFMSVGATGVIGVATHWCAEDHQEMFAAWERGDVEGARLVNQRLLESFAFETGDDNPNPIPSKVMMRHLGIPVGDARPPMGPPPAGLAERAERVWANLLAARAARR
ncbi:MAG: 4-hydroxy-tetrahydrodipicolinate synthase [Acidimicrobiia bacterium]